jgi:hypothetical protein
MQTQGASTSPGVRYLGVLRDYGDQTRVATADLLIKVATVITVAYRPDHGGWLVHHMGSYINPDDVPHSEPE